MAQLLDAVRTYGPQLPAQRTAGTDAMTEWIARSAGLNPNVVRLVLAELRDGILYFGCLGIPVRLEGIARLRPTVGRDGLPRLRASACRPLVHGLRAPGAFAGTIRNAERIGWTDAQYKALWDAEHPDDPLEVAP